ncbi:MAG: hypothetical protein B7Y56_09865 [Gallionellales bacterium 35-53-114]|jgi:hypothetical protein|nr:MAG: hypothetical protein B7Y56_09865 [Gallionellales bacterium 35-53-114]OYZ62412.1 MAG: hypothetical protein B7Y04_13720 [Gallionellales bacterium 24-53-125]OZB08474.1 MAG: hypothetical protein B7X61_09930 [Gallionellales bacterium 39-52-133]HQS59436.1 hypothetical protein [Gallionellaceae bacterium]HQS76349.1 hypothetical protein [Gallionellaceae bacterium]
MPTSETVEPLKFTDEHYIALGRMVVQFQELEQAITIALAQFMQPKDIGLALGFTHTVIIELSFATRLKLLSNFVETHPVTHFIPPGSKFEESKSEEFLEELNELRDGLKIATLAEAKRNGLIHSNWLTSSQMCGPPGTVLRFKKRAKGRSTHQTIEFVTAAEILSIAEEMQRAINIVFKITGRLHMYLHTQI